MARVLRIPCHHDDTPFVLVHVNGSAGGSSRPLDLTLVGTEGTAPYVFTLKQSKISSLKTKNGPCTQDEWALILESILLGRQVGDDHEDLLHNIETIASVTENTLIDITIRKRTEGITQRLGSFSLSYDENQEIQLFEWCSIAVQSTSDSVNELASLQSMFRGQQATINKLNAQLEELIAAKANHEAELMEKFCDLLNEKKSKIRDQQRLLTAAKTDSKKLVAVQAARESSKRTATGRSKIGKRKADNEPHVDEVGDVEEDETEKMDVDVNQASNDSDQQDIETPSVDETDTGDEDGDDDIPETGPPARRTRQASKGTDDVLAANILNSHSSRKKIELNRDTKENSSKTQPRHELPSTEKKETGGKVPVRDDDETASEDDEL